jgi:hypothetical protein
MAKWNAAPPIEQTCTGTSARESIMLTTAPEAKCPGTGAMLDRNELRFNRVI